MRPAQVHSAETENKDGGQKRPLLDPHATAFANFVVKKIALIGFTGILSGSGAAGIRLTATTERFMGRS